MYDYLFTKSNIEFGEGEYQLSSDKKYTSEQLGVLLLNALEQAAEKLSRNNKKNKRYISDDRVFKEGIELLVEKHGFKHNPKQYESRCNIKFDTVQDIKRKYNLNKKK